MKRLAILTAVLVIVPIVAMARMSSLSDNAMGVLSGQTGITLSWDSKIIDGYIAIFDDDGFGTAKYQHSGATTLGTITVSDGASGNMEITGLTIDAGSTSAGVPYCQVGFPAVTGQVRSEAVKIGVDDNVGGSLGRLTIGNISISKTAMLISTHNN